MCLLDDKSLVTKVCESTNPLVRNLQPTGDWYGADSPIQASSIDLHIGKIFLPGRSGKTEGSSDAPLDLHDLQAGQTAIVSTLEELQLPSDVAAIGFPPSRVSVQGLLMTNPGHVDPGYVGPMRFTVINMGKTPYILRRNEPIVTLLFMRLSQSVQKDWSVRNNGKSGRPPNQKDLDGLSSDFLDVTARAESIAKTQVETAGLKLKAHEKWIAAVGTIGGALILVISYWWSGLQELKTKVAELEKSLAVTKVEQHVADVEQRLKAIEQKQPGLTPSTIQPTASTTK